jgi:hypothetical protein
VRREKSTRYAGECILIVDHPAWMSLTLATGQVLTNSPDDKNLTVLWKVGKGCIAKKKRLKVLKDGTRSFIL